MFWYVLVCFLVVTGVLATSFRQCQPWLPISLSRFIAHWTGSTRTSLSICSIAPARVIIVMPSTNIVFWSFSDKKPANIILIPYFVCLFRRTLKVFCYSHISYQGCDWTIGDLQNQYTRIGLVSCLAETKRFKNRVFRGSRPRQQLRWHRFALIAYITLVEKPKSKMRKTHGEHA